MPVNMVRVRVIAVAILPSTQIVQRPVPALRAMYSYILYTWAACVLWKGNNQTNIGYTCQRETCVHVCGMSWDEGT